MAALSQCQVCLFDLYDTLVYTDETSYARKLEIQAKLCDVTVARFREVWKSLIVPSNLGRFPRTADRALEALSVLGIPSDESLAGAIAQEEHAYLRNACRVYPDTLEVLDLLRTKGFKLALVTNASPSVWEVIRSLALESRFRAIVASNECKVRKPEAGIYVEALRRLEVNASDAVFIGDGNDRELDGAKTIGLTTVQIRRLESGPNRSVSSSEQCIDYQIESLWDLVKLLGLSTPP